METLAAAGRLSTPALKLAVWTQRFWKRGPADGLTYKDGPRLLSQLARENPELGRLLASYGYAPEVREAVHNVLASIKRLIRAEITDFAAFREAIRSATSRDADNPRYELRDRQLLAAVAAAGEDEHAAIEVLNRNPIYEQVPFVERVPVMRRGEMVWLTPVNHACILKRPSDPAQFAKLLEELEAHFREPHPARNDPLRAGVLDAIGRLRRELSRERAYFPTAIQFLESRIAAYEADSLQPQARAALESLTGIMERAERVRAECGPARPGMLAGTWRGTTSDREVALKILREAASQYMADSRLWLPWITNYLAVILLSPPLLQFSARRSRRLLRTTALISSEIASGSYDSEEVARRIRRLEESGLYLSSVIYGLLALGKVRHVKPTRP